MDGLAGLQHVAIIAENTDFGQDGAKVVSTILKQKNVDQKLVTIDLNQQDFTPALLRLTSEGEKPDTSKWSLPARRSIRS